MNVSMSINSQFKILCKVFTRYLLVVDVRRCFPSTNSKRQDQGGGRMVIVVVQDTRMLQIRAVTSAVDCISFCNRMVMNKGGNE